MPEREYKFERLGREVISAIFEFARPPAHVMNEMLNSGNPDLSGAVDDWVERALRGRELFDQADDMRPLPEGETASNIITNMMTGAIAHISQIPVDMNAIHARGDFILNNAEVAMHRDLLAMWEEGADDPSLLGLDNRENLHSYVGYLLSQGGLVDPMTFQRLDPQTSVDKALDLWRDGSVEFMGPGTRQ